MPHYPRYRAVLLDRDGVLNDNPDDYVVYWRDFIWLPGALAALRTLHEHRLGVAIVTNQGCIEHGTATAAQIDALHDTMLAAVDQAGGHISAVYTCPHYHVPCNCRKPRPGNILQALTDLGVAPAEACFVGDRLIDVQAAHNAGLDGYLLRSGYQHDWPRAAQSDTPPRAIFADLAEFVAEVIAPQSCVDRPLSAE